MDRSRALRWLSSLGLGLGVVACDPSEPSVLDHASAIDDEAATGDDSSAPDTSPDLPPDNSMAEWGDPLPLVSAEAWRMASAQDDPLEHERPPQVWCPSAAWGPEVGGLEIQTGTCNYLFATQPSLAAIEEGDAIDVVVFHYALDAAEPALGHVALLLDDEVVWEQHVEIPADANVLEARVVARRAWPAGATVGLHLHNHGYNAWTLLEVSMAPASP